MAGRSSLTITTQTPGTKLGQAQWTGTAPRGLGLTPKPASKANGEQLFACSTECELQNVESFHSDRSELSSPSRIVPIRTDAFDDVRHESIAIVFVEFVRNSLIGVI